MSQASNSAMPKHGLKLFQLTENGDHPRWKNLLQDYMFATTHNVNMDAMTESSTLQDEYFKVNAQFKTDFKKLSKDNVGSDSDPFSNVEFATKCFDHALNTGNGFKDWVYTTYSYIRLALSDRIQQQTSMVKLGDLVALLKAIQLAVLQHEVFNPDDLDIAFTRCTMDGEGGNDVMLFLSAIAGYVRRLTAVNHPPSEQRKMRVLLTGLDQDIFDIFIGNVERVPFHTYMELQQAVKKCASGKRIADRLRALNPGQAESIHVTVPRAQPVKSPLDDRLDRLETIMVTMASQRGGQRGGKGGRGKGGNGGMDQPKPRAACYNWRDNGACDRGDQCHFSHGASVAKPNGGGRGRHDCLVHGEGATHPTSECHAVINNPRLKAVLQAASGRPSGQQIHATTAVFDDDSSFMYAMRAQPQCEFPVPTKVTMPESIFATCAASPGKIDSWCVDGAATAMGTWDRGLCINIRPCHVQIYGSNSSVEAGKMICTEMGDANITTWNPHTGVYAKVVITNVLIHAAFPFHIFSEIVAFDRGNSCVKAKGSWTFRHAGRFIMHCSQRLLHDPAFKGRSDSKLYWIDEGPPVGADHTP